jgi:UDP:flavonoid glycosyltransferase YjiC (YdhE family)
MRFLFACWPFEGHTFNLIAIAKQLQARGHETAFYTGADLQAVLEAAELPVFPFVRLTADHWQRVHDRERQTSGRGRSLRAERQTFRHWLVDSIPDQVDDILEILRDWQADVIVSDVVMWGPSLVLYDLGVAPVAPASWILGPAIPGPEAPAFGFGLRAPRTPSQRLVRSTLNRAIDVAAIPTRREINRIRARYGLGPLGCSINSALARMPLFLAGSLAALDYNRQDLPSSVKYLGSCLWHPPEPQDSKQWLDSVPATRPWVHATEGTSQNHQQAFVLKATAEGLLAREVEVVLTTGRSRSAEELGVPRGPNIHVTNWLSHSELLPRCSALVTVGGASTILSGLVAGVPLVIVPTTWDKPDNARRIVDAGAAIRLSPRKCTPATVRDAVEEVIGDPRYRENARRIGAMLAQADGPGTAADYLVALAAAQHQPGGTSTETVTTHTRGGNTT